MAACGIDDTTFSLYKYGKNRYHPLPEPGLSPQQDEEYHEDYAKSQDYRR
jgi:hypothetical protein